VDLVQNLNLSRQPVSPALQQLAQVDPKWQRVRHIPVGGGFSGGHGGGGGMGVGDAGRGGLGFGAAGVTQGRASVALTSSMLANRDFKSGTSSGPGGSSGAGHRADHRGGASQQSQVPALSSLPVGLREKFQRASAVNADRAVSTAPDVPPPLPQSPHQYSLPPLQPQYTQPAPVNNDYAVNPYMAGHSQGRGKHLTQPSWMNNAAGDTTSTATPTIAPSVSSVTGQFADSAQPTVQIGTGAGEGDSSGAKRKSRFDNDTAPTASTLVSGFVRASNAMQPPSAVTGVETAAHAPVPAPAKRSRWDI
jgi:hypothetical protein